jgi:hypothetical protein
MRPNRQGSKGMRPVAPRGYRPSTSLGRKVLSQGR